MTSFKPAGLKKIGQDRFQITWSDGHVSAFTFRYLRQNCGCAGCKNELTGENLLNPESVPADIKGLRADLVGNYALHFSFSDHHDTGIYPFTVLRKICPCKECGPEARDT